MHILVEENIHSSGKIEAFQNDVNKKSIKLLGGTQYITTPDDYASTLNVKLRLPYTNIFPYNNDEWNTLPYIIITLDDDWDSTIFDYSIDVGDGNDDDQYDVISDTFNKHNDTLFDIVGRYKHRHVIHSIDISSHDLDNVVLPNNSQFYYIQKHDSYNINKNDDKEKYMNT